MFNSTHTFVGVAIARTGADDWVPYAGLTAVIASNLPDIDIVTAATGTATYIDYHRGFTHSFLGVPFFSLIVAAGMYYFSGKFWRTFTVALIAMATHPVLDYLNTYGLRPFSPLDDTWYYGDILYIIDPYVDGVLLLGILAGALFESSRKVMAWVSLIFVVAYVGARIELRSMAASHVEEFVMKTPGVDKWTLFPDMVNPLAWDGIIQTRSQMLKIRVHALNGMQEEIARLSRGSPSDIVNRVAKTESAGALLRFSRFPVARIEGIRFGSVGYRVMFFDFAFYNDANHTALGSEIILDQSLHVIKETLSFGQVIAD